MGKINNSNWQYFVIGFQLPEETQMVQQISMKPLPDYECILLGLKLNNLKKNRKPSKVQELVVIGAQVNLYSCTLISKEGQFKILRKAPSNKRQDRQRPESNLKAAALKIQDNKKAVFAKEWGEYGRMWAQDYKGHDEILPTLNELI